MNAAGFSNMPNFPRLEYLINHGADVKGADAQGRTALHWIREWNIIDNPYGDTSKQFVAFVDQLIQHGINVNRQDKSGNTALMNAAGSCSPTAIKLLLSYGSDPTLKDKLGKSSLDIAIDRATHSGQNGGCNEVVKILYNPQQVSKSPSVSFDNSTPANSGQQGAVSSYAGTYGGSFNGSDEGAFQATINEDGTATLNGHSNKVGVSFTGEGKVNKDGSVEMGSVSTGTTFTGHVSLNGALNGNWTNTKYNQAGSFQGTKGVKVDVPPTNPIQAIGGLLGGLGGLVKALNAPH